MFWCQLYKVKVKYELGWCHFLKVTTAYNSSSALVCILILLEEKQQVYGQNYTQGQARRLAFLPQCCSVDSLVHAQTLLFMKWGHQHLSQDCLCCWGSHARHSGRQRYVHFLVQLNHLGSSWKKELLKPGPHPKYFSIIISKTKFRNYSWKALIEEHDCYMFVFRTQMSPNKSKALSLTVWYEQTASPCDPQLLLY